MITEREIIIELLSNKYHVAKSEYRITPFTTTNLSELQKIENRYFFGNLHVINSNTNNVIVDDLVQFPMPCASVSEFAELKLENLLFRNISNLQYFNFVGFKINIVK